VAYGIETSRYAGSEATGHITSELEKMRVCDKYKGHDQVHNTGGLGMAIGNVGHTILHTPIYNLCLRNILHVPSALKSL
jgi:hypothetical protein